MPLRWAMSDTAWQMGEAVEWEDLVGAMPQTGESARRAVPLLVRTGGRTADVSSDD